jgi:GDP-4-dehydro-6-deoxy-D-mannose reductase
MMARAVLVTGPEGFVGHPLVRALHASGAIVHGLGLRAPDDLLSTGTLASFAVCDVGASDVAPLERAIAAARPGQVVHLAGQASAAQSFAEPVATFRANALGTWNVLEAVRRAAPKARVLVVGTGEIYGPQPEGVRVTEDAPAKPVSPYALSKAAADQFAALAAERGLDVVRTRSFAHAGAGQHPRFALPSWAQQIAAAERGEAAPVLRVGNLDITRDLSDVADVVQAYRALLERGATGAAYNVCSGAGVRMRDVLDRLIALARVPVRVEVDPARLRPVDVPHLVGDPAAIARDTGWRVSIPLATTLAAVLDHARATAAPAAAAAPAPPPAPPGASR